LDKFGVITDFIKQRPVIHVEKISVFFLS
jgi:hypothetical protein